VLNRVHSTLLALAKQSPVARTRIARTIRVKASASAILAVLDDVNACLGAADRTMLHDAGWHFMQLGLQLERATVTASALRHVLAAADNKAESSGSADSMLHFRDNPELSALLRMLGSQDAYRRLFRTRSQPLFVAQFFLQQSHAPHSILHNILQISRSHQAIQDTAGSRENDPLSELIQTTITALTQIDLRLRFSSISVSDSAQPSLESIVLGTLKKLNSIHRLLGDHYFSHQARIAHGPVQTELGLDAANVK
jgi:uncharacterized alpha-E superfamily protein